MSELNKSKAYMNKSRFNNFASVSKDNDNNCNVYGRLNNTLKDIDKDILILNQKIDKYSISNNHDTQLYLGIATMISKIPHNKYHKIRIRFCKLLFSLMFLLLVISFLVSNEYTHNVICAYSKMAAIYMLPLFDWRVFDKSECIVNNPYYESPVLQIKDCKKCAKIDEILTFDGASAKRSKVSDLIDRGRVFKLKGVLEKWPAWEHFTIDNLAKIYESSTRLSGPVAASHCNFDTNLHKSIENGNDLLRFATDGQNITNWFAHWQNCDVSAARLFRLYYSLPDCFPAMFELDNSNWLFLSKSYNIQRGSFELDISSEVTLIGQLKGQINVTLTPYFICKDFCSKLIFSLKSGELLVIPNSMWINYLPSSEPENVSFCLTGYT